jgi:polar amino acid transport system substrate-binding protein
MRGKALVFGLCSLCYAAQIASAGQLEDIRAKGVLVVGTKADYPPFGYRDAQGEIIGLEPDLAADVAQRIGVKLELVPVTAANRMKLLQEGKIDLMIATMAVNEEREKAVGVIYPNYYASGVAILANRKPGLKDESDLKGRSICALKGAFYNNNLQSEYTNRDLLIFGSVLECEAALLRAECDGFVYDDTLLLYKTKSEKEKWKDYEVIQLSEFDPLPWGVAVRREEKFRGWGMFVSGVVTDWLRSEKLLTLEHKWLGTNTSWLKAVHIRMTGGGR